MLTAEQFAAALEKASRWAYGRRQFQQVSFRPLHPGSGERGVFCEIRRSRPLKRGGPSAFGRGPTAQAAFEAAVAKLSDADRRAVLGE